MDGNHLRNRLANCASRNEALDVLADHRCHGHGHALVGAQPVTVVIPRAEMAGLLDITEHVRHGREAPQTRARAAQVLAMRAFVAHHVEQRVSEPHLRGSDWTLRDVRRLRVAREEIASRRSRAALVSRNAILSRQT